MVPRGRPSAISVLYLVAAVLLSAAGCNQPLLSKQTTAKPPAEKPDFSKLRPGEECRVELSVVEKSGAPAHVTYTGTVSRVQGDEVTLVDAARETPTAKPQPVGTISIPFAEIGSVESAKEPATTRPYRYNDMRRG
jgi:hypothetical protein